MGSLPDIEERTLRFAVGVVRWASGRKVSFVLEPVIRQFVRAATGTGANRRAARRARFYKEFTSRLAVTVEEADESVYWLTVISRGFPSQDAQVPELLREATELRSILGAALATAKRRLTADRTNKSKTEVGSQK